MRTSGWFGASSRSRALAIAVALAFGLLFATRQITPSGWYAGQWAYRAQVDALLDGRLALTHEPAGLYHDLAWTDDGGVQQVWGLGAPLLQVPFEVVGRLIGWSPLPDRIALVGWLVFVFWVLLRAFPGWQAVGAFLVSALMPPIITMLRGRCQVYEDAALYAHTSALVLLAGLVIFARAPTTRRYLILLACAGATGLIRPTVWFYGLATAIAASVVWWRAGGRRSIAVGALLFVLGGGALYFTNQARFGRGSEFGHKLNVESLPGNITATRFSYPFERVGLFEAGKELVGAMFGRPERTHKKGFYEPELAAWQSPVVRWREYYFSTFNWLWLPLLIAGVVVAARRQKLLLAFVAGAAPLFYFYLRAPAISSRYMLDFAPAFAALLLAGWFALHARLGKRALFVVIPVWAAGVVLGKPSHRPDVRGDPLPLEAAMDFVDVSRPMPDAYDDPAGYDLDDAFLPMQLETQQRFERCANEIGERIDCTLPRIGGDVHRIGFESDRQWYVRQAIAEEPYPRSSLYPDVVREVEGPPVFPLPSYYLNGFGWDIDERGNVRPATLFYVRDPQFLEVEVRAGDPAKVRANIGLVHLTPVAMVSTPRGTKIRFEGAMPRGLNVAFLAFGDDDRLDADRSRYELLSVRWR